MTDRARVTDRARRLVEEIDRVWEALAALDIGVAVLDDLRVADVTDNLPEWFGVSLGWMLGQEAEQSLSPGQRDFESDRRAALERRALPHSNRATLRDAHGGTFEVEVTSASSIEPAVVAMARIDDQVRTERLLDQLMALVDHVPNGLAVFDVEPPGSSDGPSSPLPVLRLAFVNRSGVPVLGVADVKDVGAEFTALFPALPPSSLREIAALANTTDQLILDSGACVPHLEPRIFECLAVGLPGPRVALRFADLTDLVERERRRLDLQRRLVDLSDAERSRLAMAVHDDVIQQFAAAAMLIESVIEHTSRHPDLERALLATRDGIAALREILSDLSPVATDGSRLSDALARTVDHLLDRSAAEVSIATDLDVEPSEEIQLGVLKVLAELLRNVVRHADARRISVELVGDDHQLVLSVRDDGVGFDGPAAAGHHGLALVEERAHGVGGRVSVDSTVGAGTTVRVQFPVTTAAGASGADTAGDTGGDGDGEANLLLAVGDILASAGGGRSVSSAVADALAHLGAAGVLCRLDLSEATTRPTIDLTVSGPATTRTQLRHGSAVYGSIVLEAGSGPMSPMALAWLARQLGAVLARVDDAERSAVDGTGAATEEERRSWRPR